MLTGARATRNGRSLGQEERFCTGASRGQSVDARTDATTDLTCLADLEPFALGVDDATPIVGELPVRRPQHGEIVDAVELYAKASVHFVQPTLEGRGRRAAIVSRQGRSFGLPASTTASQQNKDQARGC